MKASVPPGWNKMKHSHLAASAAPRAHTAPRAVVRRFAFVGLAAVGAYDLVLRLAGNKGGWVKK